MTSTHKMTILGALFMLVSGVLWGTVIIPNINFTRKTPTPTPVWKEESRTLTPQEEATMSADFFTTFETNAATGSGTPTPTKTVAQSLDTVPPTLQITGGPAEGSTSPQKSVCFPFWVSDNLTPWQQLTVRTKFDTQEWSTWSTILSWCYDNLAPGAHTFRAQIRDDAGNIAPEVRRGFRTQ